MTRTKTAKPDKTTNTRGPKPTTLKIKGSWQGAVKKSLEKKKPAGSWPK